MIFSGKRVQQARELNGLTQKELATRMQVSQGLVAQLEGGFKDISSEWISQIARETKFPIAFFREDPALVIDSASLLFRAHASLPRRRSAQVVRYAEIMVERSRRLAASIKHLPKVILPQNIPDPIAAARELRNILQLGDGPIGHIFRAIERAGVLVLSLPLSIDGCDAFSGWIPEKPEVPFIAFSRDRSMDRIRFSASHDLGHLVLRKAGRAGADEEEAANKFASEFLMPEVQIRREILTPVTLSSIAPLKARWKVAIQALVRRCFDLHIVTERQYRYLFEQISTKGWRVREPANLDLPVEQPRLLKQIVETLYGSPINYDQLSADSSLNIGMLKEMMAGYAEKSAEAGVIAGNSKVLRFTSTK